MSHQTGIKVSDELAGVFQECYTGDAIRLVKIAIEDGTAARAPSVFP